MIKRGYNKNFVYGLLAAGGTLGILIPPSLPMIVYGFITEESVIALFLAGIGPGIFLISLFIIYSIIYSKFFGGFKKLDPSSWETKKNTSKKVIPTIILAFLILGGIYTGVFTPTEAAAVGFFLSLIITVFILKTLTWNDFKDAVFESMVTTAAILIIVACAKTLVKQLHSIDSRHFLLHKFKYRYKSFFYDCRLFNFSCNGTVLNLSMVIIMVPVLLPAAMAMGGSYMVWNIYGNYG